MVERSHWSVITAVPEVASRVQQPWFNSTYLSWIAAILAGILLCIGALCLSLLAVRNLLNLFKCQKIREASAVEELINHSDEGSASTEEEAPAATIQIKPWFCVSRVWLLVLLAAGLIFAASKFFDLAYSMLQGADIDDDTGLRDKCWWTDRRRRYYNKENFADRMIGASTDFPKHESKTCNKSVNLPEPCAGEVIIETDPRDFCVQEMQFMTWHDSEHWFLMNAWIPDNLIGGAHLLGPHMTYFSTKMKIRFVGASMGDTVKLSVFFNNRSMADILSDCKDVPTLSGGLEKTLPALGFAGPYPGPPYDVNVTQPKWWGHEHGLPAALYNKSLTKEDPEVEIKMDGAPGLWGTESGQRPVVPSLVVTGACKVSTIVSPSYPKDWKLCSPLGTYTVPCN